MTNHNHDTQEGSEECTNQSDQTIEDGNRTGDDVGENGTSQSTADPDDPMRDSVGREVATALE